MVFFWFFSFWAILFLFCLLFFSFYLIKYYSRVCVCVFSLLCVSGCQRSPLYSISLLLLNAIKDLCVRVCVSDCRLIESRLLEQNANETIKHSFPLSSIFHRFKKLLSLLNSSKYLPNDNPKTEERIQNPSEKRKNFFFFFLRNPQNSHTQTQTIRIIIKKFWFSFLFGWEIFFLLF